LESKDLREITDLEETQEDKVYQDQKEYKVHQD
jgi:hypothetical protein